MQFLFNTSETVLDHYNHKVDVRVASRVAKQFQTQDLRKLGNFKKTAEMLGLDCECRVDRSKGKFGHLFRKIGKIHLKEIP